MKWISVELHAPDDRNTSYFAPIRYHWWCGFRPGKREASVKGGGECVVSGGVHCECAIDCKMLSPVCQTHFSWLKLRVEWPAAAGMCVYATCMYGSRGGQCQETESLISLPCIKSPCKLHSDCLFQRESSVIITFHCCWLGLSHACPLLTV